MPLATDGPHAAPFEIERRRAADVLVLSLVGRLTEAFDGKALALELSNTIVFDLERTTGITSFAVRIWVDMLAEARSRLTGLYFARCSQSMARQFSMVRNFAGGGQLVSFYVPYACPHCDHEFERLFDCEEDAEVIRRFQGPPAECPRCGMDGEIDDDPTSCFSFPAQQPPRPVPREVRVALDVPGAQSLGLSGSGRLVEKSVEGTITRIRINSAIDRRLRWDRIAEGLEGHIVFDLTAVPAVLADGAANLEDMMRALPSEVVAIYLAGCPQALVERLATAAPIPRLTVLSAVLPGFCGACSTTRAAMVDLRKHRETTRGGEPEAHCDRCGAPLSFVRSSRLVRFLLSQPPPSLPPPTAGSVAKAAPQRLPTRVRASHLLIGVATAAVLFAAAVLMLLIGQGNPPPRPAMTVSAVSSPAAVSNVAAARPPDLPPPWVERSLILENGEVFVVGRGGPATETSNAIAEARDHALGLVMTRILSRLSGTPLYDHVQSCCGLPPPPEQSRVVLARMAERYLAQVGAVATPERVDVWLRRADSGVEAFVRYKLSEDGIARASEIYRRQPSFRGMTVAAYFPQLERVFRTEAGAVVVAVRPRSPAAIAGVRAGDFVISVNARRTYSVNDFAQITAAEWRNTPPLGRMVLNLEGPGGRRSVGFRRPAPPPDPEIPPLPAQPPG